MIPSTQLTPAEIKAFWELAEKTVAKWSVVQTAVHHNEFAVYRDELSEALGGVEKIESMLEDQISDLKRKLATVKGFIKDIERHEELAKSRFWRAKNAEPK